MADFSYISQPKSLSRFVFFFFSTVGLLSCAGVAHSLAHGQPWAGLAGNAVLALLVGWIGYRSATRLELTLDSATATGRHSWKTLFGKPHHRDFTFADIQQIRVFGNLNWASVALDDIPLTRTMPRGGQDHAHLGELLTQLKTILNKPVTIDPTVAQWFQLEA